MKRGGKTRSRVKVKGTIVKGKGGAHLRQPHQRSMDVGVKATKRDKTSIKHKPIKSSQPLSKGESGISDGVSKVTFADNKTGFFKPANGESFVRKVTEAWDQPNLNFQTYHLNSKTNEKLSLDAHGKQLSKNDGGRGEVKGHMVDREMATGMLGKALGMDHLPDVNMREVDGKIGTIAENLVEKHMGDNVESITKHDLGSGYTAMDNIAKTDKKAGDKALFDFMIGNADRHGGNMFNKVTKDGKSEMLAFDHGFTFPSSNAVHQLMDYHNQEKYNAKMQDVPFTQTMKENIAKFLESDNYGAITNYISENIGSKEAGAFKERMELVKDKVVNGKANTTKEVGYRKARFMT